MTIIKINGIDRHVLGWKKQIVDNRDANFAFKATRSLFNAGSTTTFSLLQYCPPIWDQGNLGSCTSHAFGALVAINEIKSFPKKAYLTATVSPSATTSVTINSNNTITLTTILSNYLPTPTPTPTPPPEPPFPPLPIPLPYPPPMAVIPLKIESVPF